MNNGTVFVNVYRYERDFFLNVVHGHGIVSWAAVDGQNNELVGFITTRLISERESEVSHSIIYFHPF